MTALKNGLTLVCEILETKAILELVCSRYHNSDPEYFQHLLEKEPYWFRIVRSILGLREHYGDAAVNASLKRALYYHVSDIGTIRNILEKKLYSVPPEPKLLENNNSESSLSRNLDYYTTSI